VLSTLAVHRLGGVAVPVRGRAKRAVLTQLVLHQGEPVELTQLAARVWSDDPPEHAHEQLQRSVRELVRDLASPEVIISGDGSWYCLLASPGTSDVGEFRRLVFTVRGLQPNGAYERIIDITERALSLWADASGLTEIDGIGSWPEVVELQEERLHVAEDRCAALIAVGRPEQAVPMLVELSRSHPLRETVAVLLVRALDRSGKRERAVDAYERACGRLADRLGLDPGPELVAERTHLGADASPSTSAPTLAPTAESIRPATALFLDVAGPPEDTATEARLVSTCREAGGTVVWSADGAALCLYRGADREVKAMRAGLDILAVCTTRPDTQARVVIVSHEVFAPGERSGDSIVLATGSGLALGQRLLRGLEHDGIMACARTVDATVSSVCYRHAPASAAGYRLVAPLDSGPTPSEWSRRWCSEPAGGTS
jgi:DNA-binding SARP family transcriptional activator